MRGFAVVGAAGWEKPLAVWLVSRANLSDPVNTNAVVWQPDQLEAPENLRRAQGMLAQRYVVVAQEESGPSADRLDGWGLNPVGYEEFRGAVAAELERCREEFSLEAQRRRGSGGAALVEPEWPKLPDPGNYGYAGAAESVTSPVLAEANRFARLWDAWARLERLRRSKSYLAPDGDERILPPGFTDKAELFELGG